MALRLRVSVRTACLPASTLLEAISYWLKTQLFNFWASYKIVYSEGFNSLGLGPLSKGGLWAVGLGLGGY